MSKKFNPGLAPQVVAVPITKLTTRQLDRSIKKLAKFFNVDNSLEDVASIGEFHGYSLGSSRKFVFLVEDGSEFSNIAIDNPEIWDLAISSEDEPYAVVVL